MNFQYRIVCRNHLRRFRRFRRLHFKLLYVFIIVAITINCTHLKTNQQNHVLCRSMKKKNNELIVSKRNWKRTRNNVTNMHRFQHLKSTFDQLLKLIFLSYHIEWQNRISSMIKFFTYVLSDFLYLFFYFDIFV